MHIILIRITASRMDSTFNNRQTSSVMHSQEKSKNTMSEILPLNIPIDRILQLHTPLHRTLHLYFPMGRILPLHIPMDWILQPHIPMNMILQLKLTHGQDSSVTDLMHRVLLSTPWRARSKRKRPHVRISNTFPPRSGWQEHLTRDMHNCIQICTTRKTAHTNAQPTTTTATGQTMDILAKIYRKIYSSAATV